jgi:hypothetical protein
MIDCLQSFSLSSATNDSFSTPDYSVWTIGGQNFWQVKKDGTSTYDIQGFKNINIHAIDVIGDFRPVNAITNGGIVQDWTTSIRITGTGPLISGALTASPNFLSISTANTGINTFVLSRFKTRVQLSTPIQSAKKIEFFQYVANGIGAQSLISIELVWNLNFVFYYTYEGEEFAFL